MQMDNLILVTVQDLFVNILVLSGLGLGVIQYGKEKLNLVDRGAEILSLVVGFLLSGLVAWYWVDQLDYVLELGQWIGVGIAVVMGGIAPSGGYKLMGTFAGNR
jgi:hypothetical protein